MMTARRKAAIFVSLALAALMASAWQITRTRWYRLQERRMFYNRVYAGKTAQYPPQPMASLVEAAQAIPPGRALDVAMGQGRNALYLARKGWEVTGFDIAEEGLELARESAQRAGLNLQLVRASIEEFDYGSQRWDLLLLAYAPVAWNDPGLVERLRVSVRPGGYVLVEGMVEYHLDRTKRSRLPGDLEPGELRRLFQGFDIIRYEEAEGASEWFPRNTLMVRMLARKPATKSAEAQPAEPRPPQHSLGRGAPAFLAGTAPNSRLQDRSPPSRCL